MSEKLKYELITVPLPSSDQLQLTRFYRDKNNLGAPVFMLHSLFQDGTSFYTDRGEGLACFLAEHGFDVYVADLRGRGKSWPRINSRSDFGCHQLINQDIPAMVSRIVKKRGDTPQIWVGHGWGSVLLCGYYARHGNDLCEVSHMVHFGARRKIINQTGIRGWLNRWYWRRFAKLLMTVYGYLPASKWNMGNADESRGSYRDYLDWSVSDQWRDWVADFNYESLITGRHFPASYYFAVTGNSLFGNAEDVRQFIKELGPHDVRLMVLSRNGGNLRNYNYRQMLEHRDCESDHFPLLLDWLNVAG